MFPELLNLNSFADLISILSAAEIVDPPNIEPPMPTPPDTVNAPVVVDVDAVESCTSTLVTSTTSALPPEANRRMVLLAPDLNDMPPLSFEINKI